MELLGTQYLDYVDVNNLKDTYIRSCRAANRLFDATSEFESDFMQKLREWEQVTRYELETH